MTSDNVCGYRIVGRHRRMLGSLALLATLAGAAGTPPPLVVAQNAGPSALDGTYSGPVSGGTPRAPRNRCTLPTMTARLHVKGGTTTMEWNGPLTGTASPNGAVKMVGSNGSVVEGSISGNTFKGTITGTYCVFQVELTKG